ncbi:Putative HAD superfamily magnesium-translocating P-type ATPase [Candidatus Trichorickettsia mobilis]|uniref:Magnesium-transporting ATPase, P-type 1 n=1 Tax=Candidatus Trichorickettsia mobilis TaxID=1346319 RepID=A0ABZ0UXS7_9RICK|nr:magnesium-translocating P-type ATPase [Candidatus Trichorickettsia mobilis]WPY01432.1 Putative HAD superfamily magnesium-translocating P-type ATPase [Candidatus Trichorickettsia mobilis]
MIDISWLEISMDELKQCINTNNYNGLSTNEAKELVQRFGSNIIKSSKKYTLIIQFLSRFKNPLILLLLVVGVISLYLKDTPSFIVISLITLVSVTLDFYQEYKAFNTIESLKKLVALKCTVIRDNEKQEIYADQLVPGDIILLAAGDIIPADCRVIESKNLSVNKSTFTGEAYDLDLNYNNNTINFADMLFMSSVAISGTAKAIVCRIGLDTEFGKIARTVASRTHTTAFEIGIKDLGLFLMRISTLCTLLVLLVNFILHKTLLESFIFAIALAVGLTPELLPMISTVTMAVGVRNMAKEQMIVKKLIAMQNIGSMNILCTDKTGTLTEGAVKLKEYVTFDGVSNEEVMKFAYLNSYFQQGHNSLDKSIISHKTFDVSHYQKIDELPFDFERRKLSVIVENNKERMLVTKGSPETVITSCNYYKVSDEVRVIDQKAKQQLQNSYRDYFRRGYRTLAIAYKIIDNLKNEYTIADENELIFAGLITFVDSPKSTAKPALGLLRENGIQIKVITGDSELVARDVCDKLDLKIDLSLSGAEIQALDDATLSAKIEYVNLFYMISPTQKSRIILSLKERGNVVGYLGDGINDAPSLHIADVGIAVAGAVDIAKESADIIMLDDNLNGIYKAVIIGRKTFANIMKYIMMVTSSNFGNMISMALAAPFLPFLPMLPLQLLINNLLYDISEIPLPFDNVEEDYLKKPHQLKIKPIYKFMLIFGSLSSIFDLITFYVLFYVFKVEPELFRTIWFLQSIVSQILVIFILRTKNDLLSSKPSLALILVAILVIILAFILTCAPFAKYLGFVTINNYLLSFIVGVVSTYLFIVQIIKIKFLRKHPLF